LNGKALAQPIDHRNEAADIGRVPRPHFCANGSTVAIEQRTSRGGRKSTVGTLTEVHHFMRLLYVKLGTQHCIHDGAAVLPQTPDRIAASATAGDTHNITRGSSGLGMM